MIETDAIQVRDKSVQEPDSLQVDIDEAANVTDFKQYIADNRKAIRDGLARIADAGELAAKTDPSEESYFLGLSIDFRKTIGESRRANNPDWNAIVISMQEARHASTVLKDKQAGHRMLEMYEGPLGPFVYRNELIETAAKLYSDYFNDYEGVVNPATNAVLGMKHVKYALILEARRHSTAVIHDKRREPGNIFSQFSPGKTYCVATLVNLPNQQVVGSYEFSATNGKQVEWSEDLTEVLKSDLGKNLMKAYAAEGSKRFSAHVNLMKHPSF